jgi:CBS domain-containing protein
MPTNPFGELTARDIMRTRVICVAPDDLLAAVRHKLIESQIGGAPVVSGGRMVGIISRTDLVRIEELLETLDAEVSDSEDYQADGFQHPIAESFHGFQKRLTQLKVKDAMRAQVVTCAPNTPVTKVAQEMVRQHLHRLVVVEGEKPVGIISSLDLAALVAGLPVGQH